MTAGVLFFIVLAKKGLRLRRPPARQTPRACMRSLFFKTMALAAAVPFCCAAVALSGCGSRGSGVQSDVAEYPKRFAAEEEKIVVFSEGRTQGFYAADGWSNYQMFNCEWNGANCNISQGVMNMSVTKAESTTNTGFGYYGAEYRSAQKFGYGFYAVCMKAADCSGVISSFFTYTNGPWDEIDIEILGKNMRQVQFNYYTDGEGHHEYLYNLGFDASEDFHEYAFDWQPGSITWYVDGTAVCRATDNIPSHPQHIMANVWNCTGHDGWSGRFDESSLPATAQYKWIAYSPAQQG